MAGPRDGPDPRRGRRARRSLSLKTGLRASAPSPICAPTRRAPFVYRLGRQVFNLERGVRFPYGVPPSACWTRSRWANDRRGLRTVRARRIDVLPDGELAEWLRSGLQIRAHRFDSGTRLGVPPPARLSMLPIHPSHSRIGTDGRCCDCAPGIAVPSGRRRNEAGGVGRGGTGRAPTGDGGHSGPAVRRDEVPDHIRHARRPARGLRSGGPAGGGLRGRADPPWADGARSWSPAA